ncbi:S1 family peptidase [Streptomyces sp. DSM 42041]|uniref:S1 family peptidase n=1 Tax=Streptomyces hazeniae TaxID=3075538 RepID=A0ABU2NXY7_9ACTN|nr:S1 family peptidase [Streptomyces sp. DSM 42041]MDT0381854.1 S1 family peptidase [Streptomyces sp. DSM 42041]
MRHRRIPKRRAAVAGAAVAALVGGSLTLANANASESPAPAPAPKTLSVQAATGLADKLVGDVEGHAGAYYDADAKRLVVNVVDAAAKKTVEAAGAEARVVEHTLAQLKSVKDTFTERDLTGTSRVVDPVTNKVVITADRTVSGAELADLKKQVKAEGGKAVLKRTEGEFTTRIAGGDAIYGGGSRCSLGFNVTVGGQPGFITAGHCTEAVSTWTDEAGATLGNTEGSSFPGDDYGLVMYSGSVDNPSEVNLYDGTTQAISGPGEATVGMQVTRSGSTTQVHSGTVEAVNASVSYPQGTVDGLIQTDVCAEPGDSGGALFAGDKAIGLTSGGSGDCSSGGQTFFQPVSEALDVYGATLP